MLLLAREAMLKFTYSLIVVILIFLYRLEIMNVIVFYVMVFNWDFQMLESAAGVRDH